MAYVPSLEAAQPDNASMSSYASSLGPNTDKGHQIKKICHHAGTGEQVMMFNYTAKEGCEEDFEVLVQQVAHGFYGLQTGISDIRVCHPREGAAAFCITFCSKSDLKKFQEGPAKDAWLQLRELIVDPVPSYLAGCLMPDTHTFATLVDFLKKAITTPRYTAHDIELVRSEVLKWYPRRREWERFIHWDESDPKKYTRNLMWGNDQMDVILMCWPARCSSSIHDHDESSCWAYCLEGEVTETQYHMPCFDRTFQQGTACAGSVGRCTDLKVKQTTCLTPGHCAYVNNKIGLHRVSNETDKPAYTVHIYAPGIRKCKVFAQNGNVNVLSMACPKMTSVGGVRQDAWTKLTDPDGIVDVDAWNRAQTGRTSPPSPLSACDGCSSN